MEFDWLWQGMRSWIQAGQTFFTSVTKFQMPTRQYTTILPNDWLQHLGKHRTFEITQSELLKIRRALDRAGSKDDFRDQYWTRVLVLRGDELILGVGSEIRVLNLDEVKDNWITVASRLIDASKDSPDSNWLLEIPYKVSFQTISIASDYWHLWKDLAYTGNRL